MPDSKMETPLEIYSASSARYARIGIAVLLMPVLLAALMEILVFSVDLTVSSLSPGGMAFIGTMGLLALALAGWALFRLMSHPLWKLIALSLASMAFALRLARWPAVRSPPHPAEAATGPRAGWLHWRTRARRPLPARGA